MFNCFTSFIPNFQLTYSCENQFADGTRPVHGMSYKAGVCPLIVITVAYYHIPLVVTDKENKNKMKNNYFNPIQD